MGKKKKKRKNPAPYFFNPPVDLEKYGYAAAAGAITATFKEGVERVTGEKGFGILAAFIPVGFSYLTHDSEHKNWIVGGSIIGFFLHEIASITRALAKKKQIELVNRSQPAITSSNMSDYLMLPYRSDTIQLVVRRDDVILRYGTVTRRFQIEDTIAWNKLQNVVVKLLEEFHPVEVVIYPDARYSAVSKIEDLEGRFITSGGVPFLWESKQ